MTSTIDSSSKDLIIIDQHKVNPHLLHRSQGVLEEICVQLILLRSFQLCSGLNSSQGVLEEICFRSWSRVFSPSRGCWMAIWGWDCSPGYWMLAIRRPATPDGISCVRCKTSEKRSKDASTFQWREEDVSTSQRQGDTELAKYRDGMQDSS